MAPTRRVDNRARELRILQRRRRYEVKGCVGVPEVKNPWPKPCLYRRRGGLVRCVDGEYPPRSTSPICAHGLLTFAVKGYTREVKKVKAGALMTLELNGMQVDG